MVSLTNKVFNESEGLFEVSSDNSKVVVSALDGDNPGAIIYDDYTDKSDEETVIEHNKAVRALMDM